MEQHGIPQAAGFRSFETMGELDQASRYLLHKAREATGNSYAPYSKFMVGAALMLEDDTLVTGGNQENASYPLCMCAERVALYAAAAVHPGKRIIRLAVVAHRKAHKDLVPATPCGACRQVLFEFEQRQEAPIRVILVGPGHRFFDLNSAADLLPLAFDRNSL